MHTRSRGELMRGSSEHGCFGAFWTMVRRATTMFSAARSAAGSASHGGAGELQRHRGSARRCGWVAAVHARRSALGGLDRADDVGTVAVPAFRMAQLALGRGAAGLARTGVPPPGGRAGHRVCPHGRVGAACAVARHPGCLARECHCRGGRGCRGCHQRSARLRRARPDDTIADLGRGRVIRRGHVLSVAAGRRRAPVGTACAVPNPHGASGC
jgi:hypothetical protein